MMDPKEDGYRSYHLIYQYKGSLQTACYNKLRIEVQLRTKLQHAWATAVEAVGIFTKQALKSNIGDKDWLRLFALMSSEIAFDEKPRSYQILPCQNYIGLKKLNNWLLSYVP